MDRVVSSSSSVSTTSTLHDNSTDESFRMCYFIALRNTQTGMCSKYMFSSDPDPTRRRTQIDDGEGDAQSFVGVPESEWTVLDCERANSFELACRRLKSRVFQKLLS